MASISITLADKTTTYELPAEIGSVYSIGRAADCNLSLPDAEGLAEHHCSLTCTEKGYAIADLGTETGTYAGENKVEYEFMAEGVQYRLGSISLSYSTEVRKKVVKKTSAEAAARIRAAAAAAAYNSRQQQINYAYVVLVLLGAFYAGMALYSWQHTGNPLPIFLR